MRCDERQRAVERFVAERGDRLLRAAALLAGSQAGGEDLLQSALERLLRNWRRIDGDPESYVRRTLYNLAADGWRRQRVWQRKALLLGPTRRPTRQLLLIFGMRWFGRCCSCRPASAPSWCCAISSS